MSLARRIDLVWHDSERETGYKIFRSVWTPSGFQWHRIAIVAANVTSYTPTGLSPETTYFFYVEAFNAAGGSQSRVQGATTRTAELRFVFPIGNPDTGSHVTQHFGQGSGHLGTDFRGKTGTPIVAAADGMVTSVRRQGPGWGWVIIIKHAATSWSDGQPVYSLYGHVLPAVMQGQQVSRGQPIGKVGPTAKGSTGPHLHFELRSGAEAGSRAGPGYRGSYFNQAERPIVGHPKYAISWYDPERFLKNLP